jgi:hypothetical protein
MALMNVPFLNLPVKLTMKLSWLKNALFIAWISFWCTCFSMGNENWAE